MKNKTISSTERGLAKKFVAELSEKKSEPSWMRDFRLKAYDFFASAPLPTWGVDLSDLSFNDICYYLNPVEKKARSWEDVPETIKKTFDQLGIVQAERSLLAGLGAQFESEVIYKKLKKEWADQGVIFTDTETGLKEYPDIFKKYFASVIAFNDNKFAALNSAVWSGGSFVYVPAGIHVTMPLQAYFRIDQPAMGQFERTLIVAESGSFVHYVEGCSAPVYRSASLHSAVVELIALQGAHIRYTTIQNWSNNVYNLVTKRALAHERATVEWIDGNFGSYKTMKYPAIILKGAYAHGKVISIAVANKNQHHDSGAKIIHAAPFTTSQVIAKSISSDGGRSAYRGLLKVVESATNALATIQCDALLLDKVSYADTYPTMNIQNNSAMITHEATIQTIDKQQLLYLQSRGLSKQAAQALIIGSFISVFVDLLPMEYAVEINRLIALEMEESIG
ncbi:MAG TPA: Fe-S cluster assembly protein SufB [Patescibacteria group bacterium]|jgi:Fe-S cluster assembly protein SufB|nr:Fe-S cluster assembly protein SufB [Patescibacteria group bacterium]